MTNQNQSIITLQVQHDDAFVEDVPSHPYQKRFFDFIILSQTSPPLHDTQSIHTTTNINKNIITYKNCISIMSYEDAIIIALLELHDHRNLGSSVHEIKKHLMEHFIKENIPSLTDADTVKYDDYFKSSLFAVAMKSLLDKGVIIVPHLPFVRHHYHSSTSCRSFILSKQFIHRKFEVFKKRISLLGKIRQSKQRNSYLFPQVIMTNNKEGRKHIPARIKPQLSKMRLVDQVAVVEKGEEKTRKKRLNGMELDSNASRQKKCTVLMQIGHNTKKGFVIKRNSICTRKRLKYPNTIVVPVQRK